MLNPIDWQLISIAIPLKKQIATLHASYLMAHLFDHDERLKLLYIDPNWASNCMVFKVEIWQICWK